MAELKCSVEKPYPVYKVVNQDNQFSKEFENTAGPYYIVKGTDKSPDTARKLPIQREIKKPEEITKFLTGLIMGVAAPAEGEGMVSALSGRTLIPKSNITHIRFVGCTDWKTFWNLETRSSQAFNALLERK